MRKQITQRTSGTSSPSLGSPLTESIQSRIIEEQGKKFKVETLAGKEFKLPLNAKGNINWKTMTDDQVLEYTRAYCAQYGVTKISQLQTGEHKNGGLYHVLRSRNLISQIFPKPTSDLLDLAKALGNF